MDYNIRPLDSFSSYAQGAQVKTQYDDANTAKSNTRRFGELASQLTLTADRAKRVPLIAEMAKIDPVKALQFGDHYQGQDQAAAKAEQAKSAENAKLTLYKAQAVRTAPKGRKVALWQQVAPEHYQQMIADGTPPTDEEIDEAIDMGMPDLYVRAGMEPPKPEQETFTGQPVAMNFNGQPGMGRVGSRGTPQQVPGVTPYQAPDRTPAPQYVALTPAEVQQIGLPPGTAAQRDSNTGKIDILSKRDNTATLSQKDATTAKMKLNTVALARKQLEDIRSAFLGKKDATGKRAGGIKGTMSAGIGQGYLPTEGGQGFDAAVDQMRSTLTALTRVPGVGAMSDYETKLDQAKFPSRKNYENVTEQQINALEDQLALIENGYKGLLGGGQESPPEQAAPSQGGWVVREKKK